MGKQTTSKCAQCSAKAGSKTICRKCLCVECNRLFVLCECNQNAISKKGQKNIRPESDLGATSPEPRFDLNAVALSFAMQLRLLFSPNSLLVFCSVTQPNSTRRGVPRTSLASLRGVRGFFMEAKGDTMNLKLARNNDPATSHAAADFIERRGKTLRERMLCVWQHHAGTMQEIADDCVRQFGGSVESYRKRGSELKSSQAIVRVGTRTCQITGASADVFRAAE